MIDPVNETVDGPTSFIAGVGSRTVSVRNAPVPLGHPYLTDQINETVRLAAVEFNLDLHRGDPFSGAIYQRWLPRPSLVAVGLRQSQGDALVEIINESRSQWITTPSITLAGTYSVEDLIESAHLDVSHENAGHRVVRDIREYETGDGTALDEITFLVANGYFATDGFAVRAGEEYFLSVERRRAEVEFDGWRLRLDRAEHADKDFFRMLLDVRGFGFTHIGRITRQDGKGFPSKTALEVIENLRYPLSLMAGRYVGCVMPIGYSDGKAAWLRWNRVRIVPAHNTASFGDETIASAQFSELAHVALAACADPFRREVLRRCLSYLMQANSNLDAELSVGASVSGLLLLSHTRLVVESKNMSGNQFRKADAEAVIRAILDSASISTSIPSHLRYLQTVSESFKLRDGLVRDALGCVVKMRHEVLHPTMERMGSWSSQQWIECAIVAQHYLETAILEWLGYRGYYHPRIEETSYTGAVLRVPWVATP